MFVSWETTFKICIYLALNFFDSCASMDATENSVACQIQAWLTSMQDLSDSAFQNMEPEPLADSEIWVRDLENNHDEYSIISAVVDGQQLKRDDLRHSFETEGDGEVVFTNGDYFRGEFQGNLGNRSGVLTKLSQGDTRTSGTWVNGMLQGMVDLEIPEGGWNRSYYRKGVLHGLTRKFQGSYFVKSTTCFRQIAFYRNNTTVGNVWTGLVGGAFLVGPLDEETGQICGKNILYLYPDLKTAISGRFIDGRMIEGHLCQISGATLDEKSQMLNPQWSTDAGNVGPKYKKDFSTNYIISKTPLLPDPWESFRVEVRRSSIDADNAGEGLYARIPISEGQIIALFNGVRLLAARNNSLDFVEDLTFEYRIRLNAETDLDIPKNYRSLSDYCATLGHKANHSFRPNARWSRFEHPRFGLICSIVAIRDICPNEEIFVNYGIKLSDAPDWYKQLWVDHLRKVKGQTDQQIKDWCGRQYAMSGKIIQLPI